MIGLLVIFGSILIFYFVFFLLIRKDKEYLLYDYDLNSYVAVKVIDKGLIYTTLAYTDREPIKVFTLRFIIEIYSLNIYV